MSFLIIEPKKIFWKKILYIIIEAVTLAGIGMPLYPLLCLLEILIWGEAFWISAAVGIASLVATPVAAGIAVLRHDLYDVDKALALAVTWGLLTALLLAVYAAVSSIAGLLVGRDSHAGVAVGTAAAALVLLPGLRVVRRAIDARTYPLRRAALAAVDDLHREVSAGRARPEGLQKVLREALRDPGLRVGFRVPGSQTYLDADGEPVPADGVAVVLDDEQTGVARPRLGAGVRRAAPRGRRSMQHPGRGGPAALGGRPGAARGAVEPDPPRRDRLRGATPDRARPARRRPAAAGLARHAAAAGAATPRRRHGRRRRPARPERRRARHRGRRAAPDRPRPAAEQPRRRAARGAVEPGPQPAADRRHGHRRQPAARRRRHDGVLRRERGDHQRGQARRGDPDRASGRPPGRAAPGPRHRRRAWRRAARACGQGWPTASPRSAARCRSPARVARGTEVEAALPCAS